MKIILASCSYTTSFIWTNVEYSSTTRDTSKRPLAIVLACISMIRWLWQIFSVTEWLSPYKRLLNMKWHFSIVVFVYFSTFFFVKNHKLFIHPGKKRKNDNDEVKEGQSPCIRVSLSVYACESGTPWKNEMLSCLQKKNYYKRSEKKRGQNLTYNHPTRLRYHHHEVYE